MAHDLGVAPQIVNKLGVCSTEQPLTDGAKPSFCGWQRFLHTFITGQDWFQISAFELAAAVNDDRLRKSIMAPNTVTQNQLNNDASNCAPDVDNGPLSATQAIYDLWTCYVHNETFALFLLDLPNSITGLDTPNSKFGPYAFYHDQFSSLYAWRNIGTSDYNALQVTYNVHWGSNLQGQFNYTF